MKNSMVFLATIALTLGIATPVLAGDFFDNLKRDWDDLTGTVKGAIEDVGEAKDDVEEINEDAKTLGEEFTGDRDDEPRYDPAWVAELQQRLTAIGLDPGPVDGAFGQKTSQSIVTFQRIVDLNPDGMPRPSVMRALRARTQSVQAAPQTEQSGQAGQSQSGTQGAASASATPSSGQNQQQPQDTQTANAPRFDQPWVAEIQSHLTELGYDAGPVDGAFGTKSQLAISAFEQQRGIQVTGLPTPSVMQALRSEVQASQVTTGLSPSQSGQIQKLTSSDFQNADYRYATSVDARLPQSDAQPDSQ